MAPSYKLLCLGNPLLDISAKTDASDLQKYNLKPNDAILAEPAHAGLYDDLLSRQNVSLLAGGSVQNSARGAQYMLPPSSVLYTGCVGSDKYAKLLTDANDAAGLATLYRVDEKVPTGKCGVLITGHDRTMCTDLGAANHFKPDHLEKHLDVIENAQNVFVEGYHLTVSPPSIQMLGKHCAQHNKEFAFSLSAPFIAQFFSEPLNEVLPYVDILFGESAEYLAFAGTRSSDNLPTQAGLANEVQIAKFVANLPKVNTQRKRLVIVTRGSNDSIVVVQGDEGHEMYPVQKVDESKIVDTTGAGDAFAGGFLAGKVQGKSVKESMAMGQWLAALSIQESGGAYPYPKHVYEA